MMRTWKLIRFTTLVAALLAVAPVVADDPPVKNTDKPDEVQRQLKDIKASLDELKGLMKESVKSLDTIQSDLKTFRTDYNVSTQAANRDIATLKEEVARLKTEVDSLRKTPTSASRESGFAPGATTAPLASGRVELLNTWSAPVAVVVNNRTYRLLPMERRLTDPIPAGTFTYEVINVTAPNIARSLAANQVYTIHIHPLP